MFAHDAVVALDHPVGAAVAQPLGHRGEALHVAEHEGDGAIGAGVGAEIRTAILHRLGNGVDGVRAN